MTLSRSSTPVTMLRTWGSILRKRHRLLQAGDDRRRQHDADDRAAPAEDRHAAEEHDGHDRQLQAGAGVVTRRREAEGPQDAGERGDQPGEHVQLELDPLDADAGELRGLGLQSDGVDRAPDRRGVEHHPEHDRQDEEEADRPGHVGVRDRLHADLGEPQRVAPDRLRLEQALGEPAVERQRADGDGDRREPDRGDEEPVERAPDAADEQHHEHRRQDRPAVQGEVADQGAGEPEHRRDRQVDLAGDDDERERQRHDRHLADVQADEEGVGGGPEVRACWRRTAGPPRARRRASSPSARRQRHGAPASDDMAGLAGGLEACHAQGEHPVDGDRQRAAACRRPPGSRTPTPWRPPVPGRSCSAAARRGRRRTPCRCRRRSPPRPPRRRR